MGRFEGFVPEPEVRFPILQVVAHPDLDSSTYFLEIGPPLTEEQHVFPLRRGQRVAFRLRSGADPIPRTTIGFHYGNVGHVGERLIEVQGVALWPHEPWFRREGDPELEEGQLIRPSMIVSSDGEAFYS